MSTGKLGHQAPECRSKPLSRGIGDNFAHRGAYTINAPDKSTLASSSGLTKVFCLLQCFRVGWRARVGMALALSFLAEVSATPSPVSGSPANYA